MRRIRSGDDSPIVPPPSDLQVEYAHRVVLYQHDGTPLVRRAGYMQTTGTFPQLTKRTPKKGTKR